MKVKDALNNPIWMQHSIGDKYTMDGKPDEWKIAYYPILECGKTGDKYDSPKALVEKESIFNGKVGIDYREIPLHYLKKI